MKKLLITLAGLVTGAMLYAQQMPISENYFLDKYSLAPSYAGNFMNKYLYMGYRSDWSGIEGGPKTFRLSYNDHLMQNAGYGGKFIYDKAGIFKQVIIMGSYSYNVKINDDHSLMFGLSAGFYSNTLNLKEFYDDPSYNIDPTLSSSSVTSKLKFMSDVSVVWAFRDFNAGFLFSNINFGDSKYDEVDVHYKPLANYQIHLSYNYKLSDRWDIDPLMVLRGGKYIKSQLEIASSVVYQKNLWGSLLFRDPGIWGIGIGGNVMRGLKLGYNFNFASNVASRFYNNHEIVLGINFFDISKKGDEKGAGR